MKALLIYCVISLLLFCRFHLEVLKEETSLDAEMRLGAMEWPYLYKVS